MLLILLRNINIKSKEIRCSLFLNIFVCKIYISQLCEKIAWRLRLRNLGRKIQKISILCRSLLLNTLGLLLLLGLILLRRCIKEIERTAWLLNLSLCPKVEVVELILLGLRLGLRLLRLLLRYLSWVVIQRYMLFLFLFSFKLFLNLFLSPSEIFSRQLSSTSLKFILRLRLTRWLFSSLTIFLLDGFGGLT